MPAGKPVLVAFAVGLVMPADHEYVYPVPDPPDGVTAAIWPVLCPLIKMLVMAPPEYPTGVVAATPPTTNDRGAGKTLEDIHCAVTVYVPGASDVMLVGVAHRSGSIGVAPALLTHQQLYDLLQPPVTLKPLTVPSRTLREVVFVAVPPLTLTSEYCGTVNVNVRV